MNETVKLWLKNLFENEILEERKTIENERIWENGCDETRNPHTDNISLHEEYLEILEDYLNTLDK